MNVSKSQAAPRRYGFACLMCRRRKIKCDGRKPNCANCVKAKEICSYKESPSYNAHLVHQLQQSKRRIDDLEGLLRDLASVDYEERDRRLSEIVRDFDHLSMADSSPSGMTDLSQSYDTDKDHGGEDLPYGKPADFSVGEHGTVSSSVEYRSVCTRQARTDLSSPSAVLRRNFQVPPSGGC